MSTRRIRLNSACITAAKMMLYKVKKGVFFGALFYLQRNETALTLYLPDKV